jgi:hypothetical protein
MAFQSLSIPIEYGSESDMVIDDAKHLSENYRYIYVYLTSMKWMPMTEADSYINYNQEAGTSKRSTITPK